MMFPHCLKARVTVVCLEWFEVIQLEKTLVIDSKARKAAKTLRPSLFASSNMVLITLKNKKHCTSEAYGPNH